MNINFACRQVFTKRFPEKSYLLWQETNVTSKNHFIPCFLGKSNALELMGEQSQSFYWSTNYIILNQSQLKSKLISGLGLRIFSFQNKIAFLNIHSTLT